MIYKQLGSTGLSVSAISLGTWGIGGAGWGKTDYTECEAAVELMLESGVNLIDTAPAYNDGQAERLLGEKLYGKREDLYYVTKAGTLYKNGKYSTDNSAKTIRIQCEESLRYMNTDYIDGYLVHWPDAKVPMEETFTELNKLKEEGKIRHIGVSNFSIEQIKKASKFSKIEILQEQYSMVYEKKKEMIEQVHNMGIGIMTYGSMGAGILSGKFREKPQFEKGDMRLGFYTFFEEPVFSKIQNLLKEMENIIVDGAYVPLSQIALNWTIQKPYIDTAIVGVRSCKHALENCKAAEWSLSKEQVDKLDQFVNVLGI